MNYSTFWFLVLGNALSIVIALLIYSALVIASLVALGFWEDYQKQRRIKRDERARVERVRQHLSAMRRPGSEA